MPISEMRPARVRRDATGTRLPRHRTGIASGHGATPGSPLGDFSGPILASAAIPSTCMPRFIAHATLAQSPMRPTRAPTSGSDGSFSSSRRTFLSMGLLRIVEETRSSRLATDAPSSAYQTTAASTWAIRYRFRPRAPRPECRATAAAPESRESGGGHRRRHGRLAEGRFRRRWIGWSLECSHFIVFFRAKAKRCKDLV